METVKLGPDDLRIIKQSTSVETPPIENGWKRIGISYDASDNLTIFVDQKAIQEYLEVQG